MGAGGSRLLAPAVSLEFQRKEGRNGTNTNTKRDNKKLW